jgi:hypothetical protein
MCRVAEALAAAGELDLLLGQVDAARLMDFTAGVAGEVRLSGSPEEARAFDWLAARLGEFGLTVRLGRRPGYVSWPGPARLRVSGLGEVACITHALAVPAHGLTGGILDLGPDGLAALRPGGAEGRIVLIDGVANPARVRAAEAAGAIAEIFVSGEHRHEMIVSPVWGSPGQRDLGRLPRTPSVSIDRAAAAKLRERLLKGPAQAEIDAAVDTRWRDLPVLEAEIEAPGGDGTFVLLSGHVDSWHLGAMDNGSANALMLEVARLLAPRREELRRGLRICFWSGHSHGRYAGSAQYADEHFFELRERCVVHVNVDSPGGMGATDLGHAIASAELRDLARAAVEPEAAQPYVGTPPLRAGDESFLGMGVPALFMEVSEQPPGGEGGSGVSAGGGLGWWWHTPADTLDKLDPAFLARDARIYLRALWRLLAEPVLPMRMRPAAAEVLGVLEERAASAGGWLPLEPPIALAKGLVRRAELLDRRADRLRELGEERVGQIRQYEPDGACATFAHRLRRAMRAITELLGRAQHLAAHGRADIRLLVEDIGYRGNRNTDFRGNVFDGCHRALAVGSSPVPLYSRSKRSIHSPSSKKNV